VHFGHRQHPRGFLITVSALSVSALSVSALRDLTGIRVGLGAF
jgi:hypothetical protein